MTSRTSLPTHEIDQLVPALARQGIDASDREIVVETVETRTVTKRITLRAAASAPIAAHDQEDTTSWSDAAPR